MDENPHTPSLPFEDHPLDLRPERPYVAVQRGELSLALFVEQVKGVRYDAALKASLRDYGQLQEIVVHFNGHHIIADGLRRTAALIDLAREQGQSLEDSTVSAKVYATGADHFVPLATLTSNHVRSTNAAAELRAIEQLLKAGLSEQHIAHQTGIRLSTIRRRMKLLRLSPALRRAFDDGRVATGVAEKAARLPGPLQQSLEDILAATGKVTGADVRIVRQAQVHQAMQRLTLDDTPDAADVLEDSVSNDALRALLKTPGAALAGEALRQVVEELLLLREGSAA